MTDKAMNTLLDILLDKSGHVENELRPKLEKAEKQIRDHIAMFGDDVVTNGEIAFFFDGFDKATLAWFTTLLLRDKVEFGG